MKQIFLADVMTVLNQELVENSRRELEAAENGTAQDHRTLSDIHWARTLALTTARRKILEAANAKD
jgi:hypothetical protein